MAHYKSGHRYEKILLANANANVQKYTHIILELHLGEMLKHSIKIAKKSEAILLNSNTLGVGIRKNLSRITILAHCQYYLTE
jgi:hypothetical protein